MITITVKRAYGAATVHSSISAPTIERALELAGTRAEIVFPIDPEAFFGIPESEAKAEARATPVKEAA